MTSPPNSRPRRRPAEPADLDDQTLENRLRIRTDYLGSCVVVGAAGEIDIATADRLRIQVIIAVAGRRYPAVGGHRPG
jgi:hypothetical protein